jgi:hypothetical protein
MNNENKITIRTTWTMVSVMIITLFFGGNFKAHALTAPKVVYNNNILYINKYNNLVNIKDIINIDINKKSSYNSVYLINDLSSGNKFLMPPYNRLISLSEKIDQRVILSRLANAIKSQETGGASAYYRHSYSSSACGAYQYMPSTWNNYMGYKNACMAPSWVQDQRIIGELKSSYAKYGDWTKAVAAHLSPARAAHQRLWLQPLPGNPTVMQYVLSVLDKANLVF